MGGNNRKIDLTVYLAKEEFVEVTDIIDSNKVEKQIPLRIASEEIGPLYVVRSHSNIPRWASFFDGAIDIVELGRNQATGALLIVKERNRLFLFSFGQGRHLAKTECIQANFGLRAALNLLDPESIRSLDRTSLESQPKQAREQSGVGVGLDFFGIDIESDLLRAITGRPKSNYFGNRLSGGDPVKLSLNMALEDVKELAAQLLEAYSDQAYKSGPFSWIDHIGEVKDKSLQKKLDSKLTESLTKKEFDRIWLCAPKIVDWERVAGFKYSFGRRAMRYSDTRIEECLAEISKDGVELALIKRRKIQAVDEEDVCIFDDTVYRFVYAEVWVDGCTHILNAGTWYSVDADYVRRIQEQYGDIMAKEYERDLPEYDDENEQEYNIRLVNSDKTEFALMDRNNIRLPDAASPIEPCDIYRRGKELIHIKRYGGSSVLSHLFNQGLVSGELLQREPDFRREFNKRLPGHLKIDEIEKRPERNEYTVVYAIVSEQENGLNLPFFSKISIKHAVNRLEAFGHRVRIAKVPVSEMKKKIKKCPPAR